MTKFVPPKNSSVPPPIPSSEKGWFSSVFKTRPQLEAEIRTLKTENALLRARTHTIIAADGSGTQARTEHSKAVGAPTSIPCVQCGKTRDILGEILAKHEGKSYAR